MTYDFRGLTPSAISQSAYRFGAERTRMLWRPVTSSPPGSTARTTMTNVRSPS